MEKYNPDLPVNAEAWLEMDELARIRLVRAYHDDEKINPPNPQLHATLHAMIENQLAEGNPPEAEATLNRLMTEGLSRHDAIHAIASVMAEHIHDVLTNGVTEGADEKYVANLAALTPQVWMEKYGQD